MDIVKNNKNIKFEKFDYIKEQLSKLAVSESLKLIKKNLIILGVNHDKFISESDLIKLKNDLTNFDNEKKILEKYLGRTLNVSSVKWLDNWYE